MAVKKKEQSPKAAEPVVTSKTKQATDKAAKKTTKKVTDPQLQFKDRNATKPKPAAKPDAQEKPKSGEQKKLESMKPALDAKRKQDAENRSAQLLETGLVVIDPKDAKIPLGVEPINAALKDEPEGVVEFEVEGTSLRLLGMRDSNATPTLAQRLAMARRLLQVGPKLPKYIKTVTEKKPDFHNAEVMAKREPEAVTKAPKNTINGATEKSSTSTLTNGVPLKKICGDINIDPKLARRILRSKGKKPGGRWEWEAKEVDAIKTLLTTEAKKLADAGKA